MIYLDWAATSPPDNNIIEMMAKSATEYFGNPSASYATGEKARKALEKARSICADVLECKPNQLTFTSGGSESNAIAIISQLLIRTPGTVILSELEHPSVEKPVHRLNKYGWTIKKIAPDTRGIIQPTALSKMLETYPDTYFVAIMGVSNEIGSIQPLDELTATVQEAEEKTVRRIHFHTDLVQAIGKIPINLSLKIDTASFSAHKFRGPRGIGLLYHKNPQFEAFIRGGGQESGIRPGTENVAGARAIAMALEHYGQPNQAVKENGEWLLRELAQLPRVKIIPENRVPPHDSSAVAKHIPNASYTPEIIPLSFPPIPGEVLARVLSESGYAVSRGSACRNNRKKSLLKPLDSLRLSKEEARGIIRISIGTGTTRKHLEDFVQTLKNSLDKLKIIHS